jgi:hypothetical protein
VNVVAAQASARTEVADLTLDPLLLRLEPGKLRFLFGKRVQKLGD